MKTAKWLAAFAVIAIVAAACGGGADDTTTTVATTQPATTATTGTTAPPDPDFEGKSVSAENCDYGGKIKSIVAEEQYKVVFTMCKPDPAFLAKAAFTPFGIVPEEYLDSTGGTGVLLTAPIGTGPYAVTNWDTGNSITYTAFADYWGQAPTADTLVYRWSTEGAARLTELRAGTVDMITNVSPDEIAAVQADATLQLVPQANPNVLYLGMTNTFAPFDDVRVRQAIAMGIDRQRIVDNFYPAGSSVPTHFTPCAIPNGCAGESWYEFDASAARALLADAGFPEGFSTSIYYRDVFRTYLPEPPIVAVEFQTQLKENLGIDLEIVPMESTAFLQASSAGELDGLYMLGWGADYPHVTNFLDFHFGEQTTQFGTSHPEIYTPLETGAQIADNAEAEPTYVEANNAIRELVPMVPIAHGSANHAALATLTGAGYPPFGAPQFNTMDPGKDTLVYMQNAEPGSLYCADETDGEALSPCQQVTETLLQYELDSGETVPALATECIGNPNSTIWTCTLRQGVTFHDGSTFDANDVVVSWAAGIDAQNVNHVGAGNGFFYYQYLFDQFINPPPPEE